jgi:hypothetical protein
MKPFATIRARTAKRKGRDAELNALLPKVKSAAALARMKDDRALDISENPSSKKDLRKIQDRFNAWVEETGLHLTQLPRVCAMSIGEPPRYPPPQAGEGREGAWLRGRSDMAEGDAL